MARRPPFSIPKIEIPKLIVPQLQAQLQRPLPVLKIPEIPQWPCLSDLEEAEERASLLRQMRPEALRGDYGPEAGVPLTRARFHFGPDDLIARIGEIKREQGTLPFGEASELLSRFKALNDELVSIAGCLGQHLCEELKADRLYATGFSSHAPLDAPPSKILATRWRTLVPNWGEDSAEGPGLVISGIMIFRPAQPSSQGSEQRVFSQEKVRAWYLRWIAQNQSKEHIPSREEDLQAAAAEFSGGVSRAYVRRLRSELAPESWRRKGRRKSGTDD